MDQNTFLDKHVGNQFKGLTFDELINKLNADVYGREMRNDISVSVKALGSAITELHDGGSGSGVGWTDAQIDLLEEILKAAAYADTGIGDKINRLIASLRGNIVLESLTVSPDKITVSAGDSFNDIRKLIKVIAKLSNGKENTIVGYEIEGTLIQGKDCPVSVSYTWNGLTITKTITVTVRERAPYEMRARFFGNVNSLYIGTTTSEVKDAVYAEIVYDDGYTERTKDFVLYGSAITEGMNRWVVDSNEYPGYSATISFRGVDPGYVSSFNAATVTYLLEGCSSSNDAGIAPTGQDFTTVITADRGAISSLKVFVDSTYYVGMVSAGKTVKVPSEYINNLGRIIIIADVYGECKVSYYLTNCTSTNATDTVSVGGAYLTVIQPNEGYELDLTEAKTYAMMGSIVYPASSDGSITILNASQDISVYGVAKPASGGDDIIQEGSVLTINSLNTSPIQEGSILTLS